MDNTHYSIEKQAAEQRPERPVGRHFAARNWMVALMALGAVLVVVGIAGRERALAPDVQPERPASAPNEDVITATPEQLKQIQVERVRTQMIGSTLETTGKVGFNEDRLTPVFAPYAGRVVRVLANKGDIVNAGQPLLIIESGDLVSAISDLSAARSDADKSRIALDSAEKSAERARYLNAQEALATKDLQAAEADLARTREEDRRANAAVSVARNRLAFFGKSADEIAVLEKSVNDQIDRQFTIRAPLPGTVVDRKFGPGQYIKPDNADPLYIISDLTTVWVNAEIYENNLPKIRVGTPVEIEIAAYPGRIFPARVSAISPTVDVATRTVHVRCIVPNPGALLKPEMFATIRVGSADQRKARTVPSSAVLSRGPESFVLVQESGGRFRRRKVRPGKEFQGYTVIEDGISDSEIVVTSGALLLSSQLDGK